MSEGTNIDQTPPPRYDLSPWSSPSSGEKPSPVIRAQYRSEGSEEVTSPPGNGSNRDVHGVAMDRLMSPVRGQPRRALLWEGSPPPADDDGEKVTALRSTTWVDRLEEELSPVEHKVARCLFPTEGNGTIWRPSSSDEEGLSPLINQGISDAKWVASPPSAHDDGENVAGNDRPRRNVARRLFGEADEVEQGDQVRERPRAARRLFALMDELEREEVPVLQQDPLSPPKGPTQLSPKEAEQVAALVRAFADTDLKGLAAHALAVLLVTGRQDEVDQIPEDLRYVISQALTTPQLREQIPFQIVARLTALAAGELRELQLGTSGESIFLNSLPVLEHLQVLRAPNCSLLEQVMQRTPPKALVEVDLTFHPAMPRPDMTNVRAVQDWLKGTRSLHHLLLGGRSWVSDELVASAVTNNPDLTALFLDSCKELTNKTCTLLAKQAPNLRALNLDETAVTDEGIAQLVTGCPLLDNLSLVATGITNGALAELGKLQGLKRIGLTACRHVDDEGIKALVKPKSSIAQIALPFWQEDDAEGHWALRSGVTADGMGHLLTHAEHLEDLAIGLANRGMLDLLIERLPEGLEALTIYSSPEMTDADLQQILTRCPTLKTLYIQNAPNLTIAGLKASDHLEQLELSFTKVSKVDGPAIGELFPNLHSVEIS